MLSTRKAIYQALQDIKHTETDPDSKSLKTNSVWDVAGVG